MPTRQASCSCGQLRATVQGDPVGVSDCHCLACQRRMGSAFSAQAREERKHSWVSSPPRAERIP